MGAEPFCHVLEVLAFSSAHARMPGMERGILNF
jgi:hypothetical protein